jgi:hypothetical protein
MSVLIVFAADRDSGPPVTQPKVDCRQSALRLSIALVTLPRSRICQSEIFS